MAPPEGKTAASDPPRGEREWPAFPTVISLELVIREPAPGSARADVVDPFVTLGGRGRFSRTLLARVVGPNGGTIRDTALKIQSDEYPLGELQDWSNLDVDERWRIQHELWATAAAAGAAPRLVDVLPAADDGGGPQLPPTLFCKERRAFFPAPCPQCGAGLATCRDVELLERQGLPRYDNSLERFLYCGQCHAAGRAVRFYALILTDPDLRTRAPVGEQTDLYQELTELARNGGPLPCAGCARVPQCYPEDRPAAGEVTQMLTPLSFYEYRCMPVERLDLHYDEFAALLGGRPMRDVLPLEDGRPAAGSVRRYLFEDDPRGKLALEILRLKVMLIGQLVGAVSTLHRVTRLPHLALSPENVMVELPDVAADVPRFYSFRTLLLGVGGARRRRLPGFDTGALETVLLEPPPLRDATYAAPLTRASDAPLHGGLLTIERVVGADGAPVTLETELTSDSFDVGSLRAKDAVQLTVRQGRPLPLALAFLAHPSRQSGRRVGLRSTPVDIDATVLRQLRSLVGQGPIRTTFAVYPCLHIPCDLQSLGVMLFTTLAANAEQSAAQVAASAHKLSAGVVRFAHEHPDASADDLEEFALALLREAEADGVLARRQLFHRPAEHFDAADRLPGILWYGALLLGLRALTQVPGFGFSRSHDDFDPEHPEGPSDHLRVQLAVLGHNIDAELLGMGGKTSDIEQAVARVRAELQRSSPEGARRAMRR